MNRKHFFKKFHFHYLLVPSTRRSDCLQTKEPVAKNKVLKKIESFTKFTVTVLSLTHCGSVESINRVTEYLHHFIKQLRKISK